MNTRRTSRKDRGSFKIGAFALAWLLLASGGAALAQTGDAHQIRWRDYTIDPQRPPQALPEALSVPAFPEGQAGYYFVQFTGPITREMKERAAQAGAELLTYVPNNAYLTRMSGEARRRVEELPIVQWVGIYQPAFRISEALWSRVDRGEGEKPAPSKDLKIQGPEEAPAGPPRLQLTVLVFQGEEPERIGAQVEALGGKVSITAEDKRGSKLLVEIPPERLDDLARIPGVKWIEPFELPALRNDTARGVLNVAPVWSAPPGLTGAGQIIAVADSGLDSGVDDATMHDDFEGRIVALSSSPVQPYADVLNDGDDDGAGDLDGGHGTHVAGSCAGDGTVSAGAFAGVAPDAGLVFQAIEQWTDQAAPEPDGYLLTGIPFNLEPFFQQAYDAGARIHTNSWGGGDPGEYDAFSEDVDQFVWDHPDALVLYAAGNDGEDGDGDSVVDTGSVTPPGTCKNCLTVGASENDRPAIVSTYSSAYGATIDQDAIANQMNGMAAFSSRGPTGAGRIKPDVVAPGTMVASVRTQASPNLVSFSDAMEGGAAGWTTTGAWAQTTADAHSAATSWHDSPGGNYAAGATGRLTSPTLNLSTPGLGRKSIQFWARWDFPDAGDQWFLEVSSNGGTTWPGSLPGFTGTQGWELMSIGLGPFSDAASFRVRFRLNADADATTGDGLYIDDVRIVEGAFGASLLSDHGLAPAGSANDQSYMLNNGTSMATPLTAGAAALARQYYTDVAGLEFVSAALLRATLINGAVDATPGQYGTGATQEIAARPNNVEGWGRVNLGNSLFPAAPAQLRWVDELAGLETGESREYTLSVTDTSVPIAITLVYHDFPGEALTNQLDLSLAPPSGPAVFPNGLAGPDTVNNVEQIFIPAGSVQAGDYTLTVNAPSVPEGPQPYAIAITAGGALVHRDPVDVMLVLDLSGSMLSPACPGCSSKLAVLKDAVEIFIQLWTALAVPADRLGIAYFRTNVEEFDIGGDVLLPVIPSADDMIGDVQSQTTTVFDLTAMGGGLQSALNRLTDAARPRNVILLTDGMQNVNPMVRRIDDSPPAGAFHLEIGDDPATTTGSGVPPTVPPTELDTALGRKINTIAVGASDPWVARLQEIASETGGLHKATTAPDDELRRFYVEELVDALRDFSPQLVGYRTGQLGDGEVREEFHVNGSARKIVLKLSWQRGRQVGFAVEKDGQDLTRLGKIVAGPFYQIYSLDLPARVPGTGVAIATEGEWVMRIRGSQDGEYQAAAIVDEPALDYRFSVGDGSHAVGQPLGLEVRLSVDGSPLTDARVRARVLKPGAGMGTLLSTTATPSFTGMQAEPSATGGQKKLQLLLQDQGFWRALRPAAAGIDLQSNGDGSYSAAFAGTTVPGSYQVIFEVEGENPRIGAYRRTETMSALVELAGADFEASEVRALLSREGPVTLLLRPRDRNGNYLGPDYAHRIRVRVSPGSAGQPEDLLDGRYQVPLSGADPDSRVEISVMDRPLFEGTLASLGTYRYALGFHTGVTDPRGDFDILFDGDALVELDLERTLSARLSLVGILGRYRFDPGFDVQGATLYLRGYLPRAVFRLFGEAGAGLYDPESLALAFGLSAGLGVDRSLGADWRGEIGADFFHLFNEGDDLEFFAYKIGLRRTF